SAVELVIGNLQIGDARLIRLLHRDEVLFPGFDDAVLENDVHRGERNPAEQDYACACTDGLHHRVEGEELHPAVASDVDLALGDCATPPAPALLPECLKHGFLISPMLGPRFPPAI